MNRDKALAEYHKGLNNIAMPELRHANVLAVVGDIADHRFAVGNNKAVAVVDNNF
jgi:hypothetical protein